MSVARARLHFQTLQSIQHATVLLIKVLAIVLTSLIWSTAHASLVDDADRGASSLQAAIPDVHEQILRVPTDDIPPIYLQVTVYTPAAPQTNKFPLVIINHGNADMPPRDQPRSRLSFASLYFLSRGYAVVQPMMRGYAGSEGKQKIDPGCDVVTGNMNNAEDIRSVINYMSNLPYIDGNQVIVAGQSFGGFNTLAVGALNISAVKGLLNFNGGSGIKSCSDPINRMVDTAGYFAEHTQIPSLWFYGTNDSLIATSTWQAAYRRYNLLGGHATLVPLGNYNKDSHNFIGYPESIATMTPPIDAFLQQIGMPHAITYSGFIPTQNTKASHYADLNDINAVPLAEGRAQYQKFLSMPIPRVFMITEQGTFTMAGGINPLERGQSLCAQKQMKCWPYAVDNEVVWVKPAGLTPIPPPSHYAALDAIDAVPTAVEGREQYQKFLNLPSPRAFLIGRNFVSAVSGGLDPLGRGLQNCKQQNVECWPYAVDDQVVWVRPADLTPIPPPSHYADLNDTHTTILGTPLQTAYQAFLQLPLPRAFVLTSDNRAYTQNGGLDPLGSIFDACQKQAQQCAAYAVDNNVVWNPDANFLKPTHFADIHDVNAVPYLQASGRQSYAKFLQLPNPRALVIASDGAAIAVKGESALTNAMQQCISHHQGCAAYALNDDVVWIMR